MLLFLFAFCLNASLNNFTPCLNIFEPDSTVLTLQGRVEGFSFFCDFRKWTYCCWLVIFLWVQFQKIRKYIIFAWPSFHYQKIILLQRKIAKKKIWEKISFFQFYFRPPKWAKRFLTWSKEFLNKLRNKFFFRCNLHKCKIKKYFFCLF